MSPFALAKAVLSVLGVVVLAAAALFGMRRRTTPTNPEPASESAPAAASPAKAEPGGLLSILGPSGIVAIVALVGTLITVIVGHFGLREQLASDRVLRATELAEAGIQREDEQAEDQRKREDERLDALYNHAITTIASGTPELQVVGVHELGSVIRAAAESERYDETVREILAGNLRVLAPSISAAAGTPVAPPVSSRPVIRAIVDVLGRQWALDACPGEGRVTSAPASNPEDATAPLPTNLAGVNFREQLLAGANFNRADLRAADFTRADLSFATVCRADLTAADLSGANLTNADLSEATLVLTRAAEADFVGANLTRAHLTRADLRSADFFVADLSFAVLRAADLRGADFDGANLRGAELRFAELGGANVRCANMADTDLATTDLTQDQLNAAFINDGTKLPDGLDRSQAQVAPEDWTAADCMAEASPAATPVTTQ